MNTKTLLTSALIVSNLIAFTPVVFAQDAATPEQQAGAAPAREPQSKKKAHHKGRKHHRGGHHRAKRGG